MSSRGFAHDGEAPAFVLATRLFVHYKFKTRKTFDPSATLIDDAYAREVLGMVRAIPDARLAQMADAFELARFGSITPRGASTKDTGGLDFALEKA
jgi:hypothetical protein